MALDIFVLVKFVLGEAKNVPGWLVVDSSRARIEEIVFFSFSIDSVFRI